MRLIKGRLRYQFLIDSLTPPPILLEVFPGVLKEGIQGFDLAFLGSQGQPVRSQSLDIEIDIKVVYLARLLLDYA